MMKQSTRNACIMIKKDEKISIVCLFRETRSPFRRVEDIKKVEGIGPAIFTGIRHYVTVW